MNLVNLQRLLTIARQELRTQLGGALFWALVLFAGLLTAAINTTAPLTQGSALPGIKPFPDSAHALAFAFAMIGFVVYSFASALMAGLTLIRDDEDKVTELLLSTPLTPTEYMLGKLFGAFSAVALGLVLHTLIAMVLFQLAPIGSDLARGPFRLSNYAVPALVFTLPLAWLVSCVGFVVGEWTRRPILVAGVPIAMLFLLPAVFAGPSDVHPMLNRALMMFDPSGIRWLFQTVFKVDRGIDFYNNAALPLDTTLVLGRLMIVGLPFFAVIASIRHFARTFAGRQKRWDPLGYLRTAQPEAQVDAENSASVAALAVRPLAALAMTSSRPSFWGATLQFARAEFRELLRQPALYVFTPLLMGLVVENATSARGAYGARLILTAGGMAVGNLGMMSWLLCLILLFYTVESLYRERATGFHRVLYAAPFRTGSMLAAKSLANAAVVLVMLCAAMVVSLALLAIQALNGLGRFEVWPFILVWGLILPPTLLLWNGFLTAVFSTVHGRYATYAVGLGTLVFTLYHSRQDSMSWLYNWTLSRALRWSDMAVLDLNGSALLLNRIFVIGLALFLTTVGVRYFPRIESDPAARRRRWQPRGIALEALRLAPAALLAIVVGVILSFQISAGFQSNAVDEQARAYRETNLATWGEFTPPRLDHVDLALDLDPQSRRMAVEGTYHLGNQHDTALATLPFTVNPAFGDVAWTLDGVAVESENQFGLHVLTPDVPLGPGAQIEVGFRYAAIYPRGFTKNGGGVSQFVLPSGVVLNTLRNSFLPVAGFVQSLGRNAGEAAAIEESEEHEEPEEHEEHEEPSAESYTAFTVRTEITAPSEYTVNAVGRKVSESEQAGRTTVIWETDYPVSVMNIVGGRWDVRRDGDTAVFYHSGHDDNVDEILHALVAARERYSEWFYPYPWRELKLSEFPDHVTNAQGFPTNIPFSEGIGFLNRSDSESRLAFLVTAHEAAHQWWANLVAAGEGPGTAHLVEGMAHYSALLLHESEHGLEGRIAFQESMERHYNRRRRVDSEKPLAQMVDDQSPADWSVVYEKGAWAQWMLQQHLGRDQALAGLRAFVEHCVTQRSRPDLNDMLEFLRPYAEDDTAYQAFIDQWFYDVVLPEFRVADVSVREAEGRWVVDATVENVGTGTAEVELAAAHGERFEVDQGAVSSNYRDERTVVVLSPRAPQQVSWAVGFHPDRIVVDPDFHVLQRNRERATAQL